MRSATMPVKPRTSKNKPGSQLGSGESVLESGKRLSESCLWHLIQKFYSERGSDAWNESNVPFHITSNPFLARAYARIIVAFWRDLFQAGRLNPDSPLVVIELGAGHGQLSFYLIKELVALLARGQLKGNSLRYVASDVSANNLRALEGREQLHGFIEEGLLSIAQFDVSKSLKFEFGPRSAVDLSNPPAVIANYIFDSVPSDAFRLESGRLWDARPKLTHPQADDVPAKETLGSLKTTFEFVKSPKRPYGIPAYDQILQAYVDDLPDTHVLMPITAMECLERLERIFGRAFMVLSSDKGYVETQELGNLTDSLVQHHDGVVSSMVNFDALARYVESDQGLSGSTLHHRSGQVTLKTVALLPGLRRGSVRCMVDAFEENVAKFSPYDFHLMVEGLRASTKELTVEQIVSALKFSNYDPYVLLDHGQRLVDCLPDASTHVRADLREALEHVWENHYPFGRDLPFEIARCYYAMSRPRESLRFNRESIATFGEHHVTLCNMAMCHFDLEEFKIALECLDRALQMNPGYPLAKTWRSKVKSELKRTSS
jgi:tetratricopeptide (TPR) repeat protein